MRELEAKYGINFRTVHRWVKETEGLFSRKEIERVKARRTVTVRREGSANEAADEITPVADEVKRLRRELDEARLYNQLLNTMIDIAEEQFGIPIRKKRGAKR